MQTTFALLSLAAAAGYASAQGVTAGTLLPSSAAPAGCSASYSGSFEITVVQSMAKRDIVKRAACASEGVLVASLSSGVLTDAKGRIGGIVANRQFQFDGPPSQTGTIYNGGFSVCSNGSLALGGSSVFYQCLSGTFYNLYDEPAGAACMEVLIDIIPCGAAGDPVPQATDGQPAGPSATVASQISDGQPQAPSATPICEISDGQPQAGCTPVSQFTDGQIQVTAVPPSVSPVAQITDGQIQASTVIVPVSQISDGQVQATPVAPVSQISDGQVQATPVAPVSQISDGQVQATTMATVSPVAQITDGQIQAGNSTATASMPAQFTGAANTVMYGAEVLVGAIAVAAFAVL